MSRIVNTSKNFAFSVMSTFLTSVLGFISRTVFIKVIGMTYLGVNGLFVNILSLLSFTELGIGSAIAFSLYKPLAIGDIDGIKSLMLFYKKAYRWIALVIAVLGLCVVPFLDVLIKDPGEMQHIPFIYLVFLYNTVSSYLFSYKATLLSADQKAYLMTRVNMLVSVIILSINLVVLITFKNYFIYLVVNAFVNTAKWFFINRYIYKRYPYLKDKDAKPLDSQTKNTIAVNVKAMMLHKVGDLCINQTDNIIISSIINITAVALYNNYNVIIGIVNSLASSFFGSATASLGNLIATESYEKRYDVFKKYNFLGFWVYGWTGICLLVLLNPFIEIWIGREFFIDNLTLFLVMLNYYLRGMRVPLGNFKIAAGIYKQDQWAPLVQSLVNLSVSIVAAKHIGLAGVFLGTVVSSMTVPFWYRPVVVYKYAFNKPAKYYFITYTKYFLVVIANLLLVLALMNVLTAFESSSIYVLFFMKLLICVVVPNSMIILLFRRTDEFRYIIQIAKNILGRKWS